MRQVQVLQYEHLKTLGVFMPTKPTLLKVLDIVALIMLGVATYFALVKAPTELVM